MTESEQHADEGMGGFAAFWLIVGVFSLFVSGLAALNTIFDLNLTIGAYGSGTELPNEWDGVFGLAAGAVLIILLSLFGGTVGIRFRAAKGKPLMRVVIAVGGLGLVAALFFGIWFGTVMSDYGSMLAYYCGEDGTLEDVQSELAGGPTQEELDRCIERTGHHDRHEFLETVIAAGGNFKNETASAEDRYCALNAGSSLEYARKAIELGATPDTCPESEAIIYYMIGRSWDREDHRTAEAVKLLITAGWDPTYIPKDSTVTAVEAARKANFDETAAVLEAHGVGQ